MSSANSSACYVGSFDPMTLGHLDIIRRAARIFGQVTVGIGINPDKNALFSPGERLELCRAAVSGFPNVEVLGLMVWRWNLSAVVEVEFCCVACGLCQTLRRNSR